jgi:hypothetical protein
VGLRQEKDYFSMKNSHPLVRHDFILAVIIFFASMTLYIRTLAPGLLYGDSAEFQTLAYTFGITHPNGYPVFVLLMRLFTALLPIGELAWRVNLLSAVCGSLTAMFGYLIVRILSGSRIGAIAGSMILIVNPIFWWNSILIEVYVPSAMFVTLIILLTLLWKQTEKPIYLAFAGLVGGLGLGLHGTVPVLAPAVLVYLVISARTKKAWLAAIIGACIGILLVPITFFVIDSFNASSSYYNASVRHALFVWNMTPKDFDSLLERFNFVYFARQFDGPFFGFNEFRSDVKHYLQALFRDFSPFTITAMLLGGVYCFLRSKVDFVFLALAYLCQLAVVLTIGVIEVVVFYVPGYAILAIFAGMGIAFIFTAARSFLDNLFKQNTFLKSSSTVLLGILLILGCVFPYLDYMSNAWDDRAVSFLENTPYAEFPLPLDAPDSPHEQASILVNNLEDNAVVFTTWVRLYSYYFVSHVEQGRTNMRFHELYPSGNMDGIAQSTVDYIKRDFDKRLFYFEYPPGEDVSSLFNVELVDRGKPIYLVTGIK